MSALTDPLTLPGGLVLANRLCRAAMTEGIASARRNDPTVRHERLYAANARGGAGLVLTGNMMVDRRSLERARNVVIDAATDMDGAAARSRPPRRARPRSSSSPTRAARRAAS